MSTPTPEFVAEGRRFGRFVAAGALNTLVGLGVIFGVKLVFEAPEVVANACGYAVGLTVSFSVNRNWVFRSNAPARAAVRKFLIVFAIAYATNLAVLVAAADGLGVNGYLAQTLGVCVYTALFYFGSRSFVFRPNSITHCQ
jgi:putative flippase GtrA